MLFDLIVIERVDCVDCVRQVDGNRLPVRPVAGSSVPPVWGWRIWPWSSSRVCTSYCCRRSDKPVQQNPAACHRQRGSRGSSSGNNREGGPRLTTGQKPSFKKWDEAKSLARAEYDEVDGPRATRHRCGGGTTSCSTRTSQFWSGVPKTHTNARARAHTHTHTRTRRHTEILLKVRYLAIHGYVHRPPMNSYSFLLSSFLFFSLSLSLFAFKFVKLLIQCKETSRGISGNVSFSDADTFVKWLLKIRNQYGHIRSRIGLYWIPP